ncbi:hypothetical protein HOY80DRAFT_1001892 [Tuber brumale]|nr:hypothetical protein HOY80DRAFT_1001892 [Tuber brumale]
MACSVSAIPSICTFIPAVLSLIVSNRPSILRSLLSILSSSPVLNSLIVSNSLLILLSLLSILSTTLALHSLIVATSPTILPLLSCILTSNLSKCLAKLRISSQMSCTLSSSRNPTAGSGVAGTWTTGRARYSHSRSSSSNEVSGCVDSEMIVMSDILAL